MPEPRSSEIEAIEHRQRENRHRLGGPSSQLFLLICVQLPIRPLKDETPLHYRAHEGTVALGGSLSAPTHKFRYVLFEDRITGWTGFSESCLSLFPVLRVSVSPRSPGDALEQPVCLVWPNGLVDPVILSEEPPVAVGNTSPYLRICVLSNAQQQQPHSLVKYSPSTFFFIFGGS